MKKEVMIGLYIVSVLLSIGIVYAATSCSGTETYPIACGTTTEFMTGFSASGTICATTNPTYCKLYNTMSPSGSCPPVTETGCSASAFSSYKCYCCPTGYTKTGCVVDGYCTYSSGSTSSRGCSYKPVCTRPITNACATNGCVATQTSTATITANARYYRATGACSGATCTYTYKDCGPIGTTTSAIHCSTTTGNLVKTTTTKSCSNINGCAITTTDSTTTVCPYGCSTTTNTCYTTCAPGSTSTQSCGISNTLPCKYGTQTRTCTSSGTWGTWSACIGAINPITEICGNGIDEDCNGADLACTCTPNWICMANQECQLNPCIIPPQGCTTCPFGCDDLTGRCKSCTPTAEICDGKDNNCDGLIDNGLTPPLNTKQSGVCINSKQICAGPIGWQDDYTTIPTFEATETLCDGLDNDCSGQTDDALVPPLNTLQSGVCASSTQKCNGISGWQNDYTTIPTYSITEICADSLDNNCDNQVNEGCTTCACTSGTPCTATITYSAQTFNCPGRYDASCKCADVYNDDCPQPSPNCLNKDCTQGNGCPGKMDALCNCYDITDSCPATPGTCGNNVNCGNSHWEPNLGEKDCDRSDLGKFTLCSQLPGTLKGTLKCDSNCEYIGCASQCIVSSSSKCQDICKNDDPNGYNTFDGTTTGTTCFKDSNCMYPCAEKVNVSINARNIVTQRKIVLYNGKPVVVNIYAWDSP